MRHPCRVPAIAADLAIDSKRLWWRRAVLEGGNDGDGHSAGFASAFASRQRAPNARRSTCQPAQLSRRFRSRRNASTVACRRSYPRHDRDAPVHAARSHASCRLRGAQMGDRCRKVRRQRVCSLARRRGGISGDSLTCALSGHDCVSGLTRRHPSRWRPMADRRGIRRQEKRSAGRGD